MSDKVNVITERGELPDNLYREVSSCKNLTLITMRMKPTVLKKLNVPLQVITFSTEQISDPSVKSAIERGRKIKGWFSVSEGKVYVYLPNASGIEDVKQTIFMKELPITDLGNLLVMKGWTISWMKYLETYPKRQEIRLSELFRNMVMIHA